MKKLILVALGMGAVYVLLLRAISNFITRETPAYLEALKLTDGETAQMGLQTRKAYLHRQTLDALIDRVCATSANSESCWQDLTEESYVKREVAKFEDIMSVEGETNLTILSKLVRDGIDREAIIHDIWYKRILTDVLLYRER